MTGNNCLIDTSIILESFKGNKIIAAQITQLEKIFVSVTIIGELNYGAYHSANHVKHFSRNEIFLNRCQKLILDSETADFYGKIKAGLAHKGKPIPENDIWIAATAIQHNLSLFTSDKHFKDVDGLQLFNPLTSI